MKRILVVAAGIVVLVVVVALVVPFFLPKDTIKRQIVSQVETATGWRLRLDGSVGLSLLPSFSLSARDVGLSGEAGADGVEFAKVEEIDFGLSLTALVGGTVRITGITLHKPQILLETDAAGRTSWAPRRTLSDLIEESLAVDGGDMTLPPAPGQRTDRPAAPASSVAADEAGSDLADLMRRVQVDELTIVDGTVSFADKRSGSAVSLQSINTSFFLPSAEEAATLEGSLVWQGTTFDLEAELGAPLALAENKPSEVTAQISGDFGTATLSGTIAAEPLGGTLRVGLSGGALDKALAAFGVSAQGAGDIGAYKIAATADLSPQRIAIEDLSASAAGSKLTGRLVADTGKAEPVVAASLAIDTIALDRFGFGGGDPATDRIEAIDLDLSLDGLSRPATAKGGLTWNGERFALVASAAPEPLLAGKPAAINASLSGSHLKLGAKGTASLGGAFDGRLSFETANLRDLLAWTGNPLPPGDGLKRFAASGRIEAGPQRIGFSDASLALDGTSGTGKGEIVLDGAVPRITATLALDQLVLDPYLGGEGSAGGGNGGKAGSVNGGAKSAGGWSREAIDFSALKAVDADLALSAKSIRWDDLKIDKSRLTVAITGGKLRAGLDPLSLYQGVANGVVNIDGTQSVPAVTASLDLNGLEAHPFLTDIADFRALHGKAAITFDLAASGASQAALASSLSGKALVKFTKGSIRGINIPQMVRNLSVATLLGWGKNDDAQATDFNELSANFVVDKGVATTSDLNLVGPLVRVSGGGKTDIGQRTLDWRVEPKIVASLEGKEASDDMVGLGVPVVIRGPWDKPQIYPDIAGILENPGDAYKKLQSVSGGLLDLVKKNPGKAVQETVKQLGGGIDINKVMDGEVDDEAVLKTIEQGFKVAPNLFGLGKKKKKD
ncbi:uncharacterized protein involved in outer membrane biogenesis [Breoghania corrubedonensis]|uniref:Uncharacterized protein involved in outer membrane biogenesis n=1 Tax=Breoghania corrubedonensis TaxID=665038 RepID=A0A2T5V5P0_9HYPH|nr:AsmA family protein [Breoghania corrubedonensis]PTW59075.1 uncharacterized protein involved in outer membrane biogenesis [Breoghania corrubedonensis]